MSPSLPFSFTSSSLSLPLSHVLFQDYVVLASRRQPSAFSPSYLIALRSVEIPELPRQPGIVRNETKSSGFIIYPISDKISRVAFINQMSPSTASYYSTDIIGASKKLQESFINIRQKVMYGSEETAKKGKDPEEPHYSDADCKQQ